LAIDIRGTTTANKGAQLMFEAVVERFQATHRLTCPTPVIDWDFRTGLGVRQDLQINRVPRLSSALSDFVPDSIRSRYGLTATKDLEGVLDASGFAYSDSFGPRVASVEAAYASVWRKRGIRKILLPQAFGPFTHPGVAKATRLVIDQSEITFVRDAVSEQHVAELGVSATVRRAPDFTIGIEPATGVSLPVDDFVALVPNGKMITKAGLTTKDYVTSFSRFADSARKQGLEVLVVNHESSDLKLSKQIAEVTRSPIFADDRPRTLKAALSQARVIVASRFHAAVGGLSTGVPTVTVGWSHKYAELLEDFGVPEWGYVRNSTEAEHLAAVLNDKAGQAALGTHRVKLRAQVEDMWETVKDILG
jgi:polysaccharide pyruvyl transferase WcaK-like protein